MPAQSQRESLERRSAAYADQLRTTPPDLYPNGARAYFQEHSISYAIALKYGLGIVVHPEKGDERFSGMVSLPYRTRAGVAMIKFRNITGDGNKYEQPSGQTGRLYNPEAFFSRGSVIGICEGEFDAIAATEILGIPSVGAPGAKSWKPIWREPFLDFSEVIVFGDGDSPGYDFAREVAERIGRRARIVMCPDQEDVSSMCAAGRQAELLPKEEEE